MQLLIYSTVEALLPDTHKQTAQLQMPSQNTIWTPIKTLQNKLIPVSGHSCKQPSVDTWRAYGLDFSFVFKVLWTDTLIDNYTICKLVYLITAFCFS